MRHDAFFFFGVLLFIFLVWIATGGPSRPISWAGPFLNPPAPLGNGQAYFLSGAGFQVGGTGTGAGFSIGTGGVHLSSGGGSSGSTDPAFFTNPSPYRGTVTFDTNPTDPEESLAALESVTIDVSQNAASSVNITGWRLVSSVSSATIGSGALVPTSGSVNSTGSILVAPGDRAIIVSGRSPNGVSFRENECTGYLDQYQAYHPSLDTSCPRARDEYDEWVGNDDSDAVETCEDFLSSVNRCEIVDRFPKDSDGTNELSTSCRNFITDNLTYNSCVSEHRNDADFAGDTWRVFLGSAPQLWSDRHDTIRLLDTQGRTVDVLVY